MSAQNNYLEQQAINLGAVKVRVFSIETYEYGIGRKYVPFSYHFLNSFGSEICYYIEDLKDMCGMNVLKLTREWDPSFYKGNPAFEDRVL